MEVVPNRNHTFSQPSKILILLLTSVLILIHTFHVVPLQCKHSVWGVRGGGEIKPTTGHSMLLKYVGLC